MFGKGQKHGGSLGVCHYPGRVISEVGIKGLMSQRVDFPKVKSM